MSRIERALELASQMRNGVQQPSPAGKEAPPTPAGSGTLESSAVQKEMLHVRQGGAPVPINRKNRLIATLAEPHSAISEQYRKLKSRLVHLTKDKRMANLLMVTSAVTGEGKSLTATNLAISLAQELDSTVLLVDADLRRPSIHRYLGFEQRIGLAECLMDGVDIGDAIVSTELDRLSVLTAGKEVDRPLELFDSQKMQTVIAEIKHRHRDSYIIIDTPPLLPFAEPRALAHMVDGIVFVIREGVTTRESISESMEILEGSPMLGMVLNESTGGNEEYARYGEYYRREINS